MRKHFSFFISTLALILVAGFASAQLVSSNMFLQGRFVEIGAIPNGALGSSVSAPGGYHPRMGSAPYCASGGSNLLAMVSDFGHDGWTTGTPGYMGDYTLPGTPWEEWDFEDAGTVYKENTTGSSCTSSGGMSGSFTSFFHTWGVLGPYYSATASSARGLWNGNVDGISIKKEYRVDTQGSALVVTVVLVNTTGSTIDSIFYMRTCDPDNDEPISGGSFTTDNIITYQNDYRHRVQVTAYATGSTSATGIPPAPLGLAAKDCRAKAIIYSYWPLASGCDLGALYNESATCAGTTYYAINTNAAVAGDIAIGIIFRIGSLAAHDSTLFSYAYTFDAVLGIDSAFPEPVMVINGTWYDSFALITACGTSLGDTLPVDIYFGLDKSWSWSHWAWSASSASGAAALITDTGVVSGILVPSLTGTTTYTITGTHRNGSCRTKTFILTIVPTATGLPTATGASYCEGDTPYPLSATGINLMWYTTASGGTGSPTAPTPSTAVAGTFTYYVSENPCGVESARVPVVVYVTARPVVTASNNGPVCANTTLSLYASDTFSTGTITYNWNGPGAYTSTLQNPSISPATTADSGMYIVTLSVNGCVSLPDTEVAIVHPSPDTPGVRSVTYCQFEPTVALVVTGSNILWYTSATGGSGTPGIFVPSSAVAGVFNYWFTQTVNGCESPRNLLTVTINAKPSPPTVVAPTYCQFDYPSALTGDGTSLMWYGPGITGGSTTAPTPSTTTPGVTDYYVTQTVLGCTSDSSTDVVTVNPQPAPPVVVDTTYCQFSTAAPLFATGTDVKWYNTSSGGTALSATPVPSTANVGDSIWYATQTITGCESPRAAETVTILYLPVFTISQSRPYVCEFDTLTFSYNGPALTIPVYTWTLPTGATYVTGTSLDPMIVARFDSLYLQNVVLTAADYGGRCATSDTLPINVVYQPTAVALVSTNQILCQGDTIGVALSGHSGNAADYTWNFDGASIITSNSNSGGPFTISWSDSGIHVISLTAYTTEGCPGRPTYDTIDIHTTPGSTIITPTITEKTFCNEDSVLIETTDSTHYDYSYQWAPAEFFNNSNKPAIWGKIEFAGWITLTVTDPFGCRSVDSIYLDPSGCCSVFFPSAFTPNGDGRNDKFRPVFQGGDHTFAEFRVANRWGQTIFEASNSSVAWDGTFGGVPQDMGVYYYFIKYKCANTTGSNSSEGSGSGSSGGYIIKKGEVTLIR